ncbi:SDR family NAD(P)-dependent oxidoreductase [uncultured Tateyamaria sp.]|uniref:SDR family NAD(P)-dependent oxidoreductase n=1 Tax=uncultured Tateyamaria sp. TaxID=455651 RepID=UPI00262A593C|nr:SDR family NAD(P)-dependent oxidoreductase [uncultured Tateyamaria sp.]
MFRDAIEKGGVAVVTGAASGAGFEAAREFYGRGVDVVLADLPGQNLDEAADTIARGGRGGGTVTVKPTDVSDPAAMADLAETAFAIGPVCILMNNAGISRPTKSWAEAENWRRMIEVNLFGVINGIQAFVPSMVEANRPAAVINTGSKQGITTPPGNPGYNVTKAGVKVTTEMLAHDLRAAGAPISAHLFVPGFTYTGMIASFLPEKPDAAWTSKQTVDHLFARAEAGDFYILCPDNEVTPEIDARRVLWASQDITENRPALSRWHPDFELRFKAFENG